MKLLSDQMENQVENQVAGPVVLINKFNVDTHEVEQFLKAWKEDVSSSKINQDLSLHNYTKALERALFLSIMQFGIP